jgi:hypothetical protein
MYSKSKFLTFILSFIPGLSHLYLGFAKRALIFFGLFFGTIFGMLALSGITGGDMYMLLAFALPLIWFFALLDAFSLIDRVRHSAISDKTHYTENETFSESKKLITAALSLVPFHREIIFFYSTACGQTPPYQNRNILLLNFPKFSRG